MIWKTETHQFTATICQRTGKTCPAMARMARTLAQSVLTAGQSTTRDLEIEGSVELAYCASGCTARFSAQSDEVRVYCGVEADADVARLDGYANLMFGTEFTTLPSGMIPNPPCAMLQALALEPKKRTQTELRAST